MSARARIPVHFQYDAESRNWAFRVEEPRIVGGGQETLDEARAAAAPRRDPPAAALVLMGCYVDAHPGDTLGADVVVPNAWKRAPDGVEAAVVPPGVRRSRYVLKVQDGCDNRCTFCIVWQTRGRSLSRVLPYLERRGRAAAQAGVPENGPARHGPGSSRGGPAPPARRPLAAAAA